MFSLVMKAVLTVLLEAIAEFGLIFVAGAVMVSILQILKDHSIEELLPDDEA